MSDWEPPDPQHDQQPSEQPPTQEPIEPPIAVTGVEPRHHFSFGGGAVLVPPPERPQPVPLPVQQIRSSMDRRMAAVIVTVAALVIIAAGVTTVFAFVELIRSGDAKPVVSDAPLVPKDDPNVKAAPPSPGAVITDTTTPGQLIRSVVWVGGRYVVAQQWSTPKTHPVVTVWDAKTATSRQAIGYRVVSVEPGSTRLWLEPDDGTALVAAIAAAKPKFEDVVGPVTDVVGDGVDSPQKKLVAWDVSKAGVTIDDTTAFAWRRWKGPGAWSLEMQVDSAVGAYPKALTFSRNDAPGSKVAARLPSLPGVLTWEPIAWSPSGLYLIVRPLPTAVSQPDPTDPLEEVVLDARTGTVCPWASAVMSAYTGFPHDVAWDDKADQLYGMTVNEDTYELGVGMAEPSGSVADVPLLNDDGTTVFSAAPTLMSLTAADPGSPMFTVTDWNQAKMRYDQRTWLLRAGAARSMGRFANAGAAGSRYSPTSGLFVTPAWSGDQPDGYDVKRVDGTLAATIPEP